MPIHANVHDTALSPQLVPNAWVTETLAETVQYSAGLPPLSTLPAANSSRRVLVDVPTSLPDQLDCACCVFVFCFVSVVFLFCFRCLR